MGGFVAMYNFLGLRLTAAPFNLPQTENTEPLTLELVPTLPTSETEDPIPTP